MLDKVKSRPGSVKPGWLRFLGADILPTLNQPGNQEDANKISQKRESQKNPLKPFDSPSKAMSKCNSYSLTKAF
jgi:hypothetical protein